jgi:hypothetical protein
VGAVRDEGNIFGVSRGADHIAIQTALRIAIEQFVRTITVNGSNVFKKQAVVTAALANLSMTFDDAATRASSGTSP